MRKRKSCGCLGSARTKKRCFTVNNEQICEGDTIVQGKNRDLRDKIKGICGGYVITEGAFWGRLTTPLIDLKRRMANAKSSYEIIKK